MSFFAKCTDRETWVIDDYDSHTFCRIHHPDLEESGELICTEYRAQKIVDLLNTKCKTQGDCQAKTHIEYGSRGSRFNYLTFTHLPSQEKIETRLQHDDTYFTYKFNQMFDDTTDKKTKS